MEWRTKLYEIFTKRMKQNCGGFPNDQEDTIEKAITCCLLPFIWTCGDERTQQTKRDNGLL